MQKPPTPLFLLLIFVGMVQIGRDIELARQWLEQGNVVGIPTETVYGLAGNALDADAVLTIFRVKNRPAFDPLIVHTDSLDKLTQYVRGVPPVAQKLATAFWPGPLTLLLPKHDLIPDLVTSGLNRVAVRIPNHPLTLALLRSLKFPLAAPSANPFGYISPTTAQHVADQLGSQIPYVLDGGPCAVGLESTIIGWEDTESRLPIVYRLGGMALEQIEAVTGPVEVRSHSTSNPQAPGMLSSHYAPRKPLFLVQPGESVPLTPGRQAGALAFREPVDGIRNDHQRVLSPTGDLAEAAKNLFAHLRALDALDVDVIYAELLPNQGLGAAINDRLKRAGMR